MSLNRYDKRRDANANPLIALGRSLGAVVVEIHQPVDLLVGWRGAWYPTELKTASGKYTQVQISFLAAAGERQLPVWTWRSEDDVLRCLGAKRGA